MHTLPHAPRARRKWHGGPLPEYRPSFTEAEIAQARVLAKRGRGRHAEVQRARLAVLLQAQPELSSPAAARRLGQSLSWVRKWRRRWAISGFSVNDAPRAGRASPFPAWMRALVIAIACELPSQRGLPLSRHFASSIRQVLGSEGVAMSLRTVQRILAKDCLKPWRYRSWIHPRDPQFVAKAKVILGLYERVWQGQPLDENDLIVSADEKPGIQARQHQVKPPRPGLPGLVESDYRRCGAWQYLCAWDVLRGIPWGRCELKTGIAAFQRLVDQVMTQEPYRSARRVFWIVDNGSSHRGQRAVERLEKAYPNLILVHTPVHASWLNQVEIFFGMTQRKVLTPASSRGLTELADRILAFEADCRSHPKPFRSRFTRAGFERRLQELAA